MILNSLLIATYLATFTKAYTTVCNPLKDSGCSASDTALTNSPVTIDFSSESGVTKYFENYSGNGQLNYTDDGLELTLAKRYDNPSLKSNFYLMFGRVEIITKPAYGTGVVSTIYLQSDDLDEIDFEWVGVDTSNVQTNYFSKGDTTTYDRGEYNGLASKSNLFTSEHNYTVDWTNEYVKWYIDGELVRTLANSSSEGFPQTPMALFVGVWAGGDPSNSEGTIEWAGGAINYADAPFTMLLKSMTIENYSTGSSYSYSGTTGTWESIDATNGKVLGALVEYSENSTTASSSTSTAASTSAATSTAASSTAASTAASSTSASSSSIGVTSTVDASSTTTSSSSIGVTSTVDASGTTTLAPAVSSSQSSSYVTISSSSSSSILTTTSAATSGNSTSMVSSATSKATISSSTQVNGATKMRAAGGFSYNGNSKIFLAVFVSMITLLAI